MAEKPIKTPLPADLPEDWNAGQIVAPDGTTVGLTEQHGYNYLMAAVNRAQRGVNEVNEAFETVSGKRTCCFVVGTSTAGWTEADCDFLCDGVDDQVEIQAAINALPTFVGGEVFILSGKYHLTGSIETKVHYMGDVLRGNGYSTILIREKATLPGPSTSNALIRLSQNAELRDMLITSSVNAEDEEAVQVWAHYANKIRNVGFYDYATGGCRVKFGIIVDNGFGNGIYQNTYIENCEFAFMDTAVLLDEGSVSRVFIKSCTCRPKFPNYNSPYYNPLVPHFVKTANLSGGTDSLETISISGNQAPESDIIINTDGSKISILDNVVSGITITNSGATHAPSVLGSGNVIEGNIIQGDTSNRESPSISLGEYTCGWFVTGNQIRNPRTSDNYWPIVDSGVKNDVRFNSNDQGGSTPATVQQATPTISVNDGTVTARATQAAGYVAAGTRSATYQISSADDANLMPENIKEGVSIFSVTGNLQSGGGTGGVTSSNGSVADIQAVTQAEYDALTTKNPTTLYLIKE